MSKLYRTALVALALVSVAGPLADEATADGRKPGSLLIFPVFDSRPGSGTLIHVVNTRDEPTFDEDLNLNGVIDAHFIYIDSETWTEYDRIERLTPNDVLSVVADFHNPNFELGFLFVVALDPATREPADLDWLIGDEIVVNAGRNYLYALDAIAFEGLSGDGTPTDLNENGRPDLDGMEYEAPPDQVMASFLAQNAIVTSDLILVGLAPSSDFLIDVDLDVFNNGETQFSEEVNLRCWNRFELDDTVLFGNLFTDAFLRTTPGFDVSADVNSGWVRLDGDRAIDLVGNEARIEDPPFVGAIAQAVGGVSTGHLLHEQGTNPLDLAFAVDLGLFPNVDGTFFAVQLASGDETVISGASRGAGPVLANPVSLALDRARNRAFVLQFDIHPLVSVDLVTGDRALVTSSLLLPTGVTFDPASNRLLVVEGGGAPGVAALVEVDLATSAVTLVSGQPPVGPSRGGGPPFAFPKELDLDLPSNRALVVDRVLFALFAVDLATGDRTVISDAATGAGPLLDEPRDVALDLARNRALVTSRNPASLLAVDLTSGNRTLISGPTRGQGFLFTDPEGVVFDRRANRALVADEVQGVLVAVDLSTGNRKVVSGGGSALSCFDVDVE